MRPVIAALITSIVLAALVAILYANTIIYSSPSKMPIGQMHATLRIACGTETLRIAPGITATLPVNISSIELILPVNPYRPIKVTSVEYAGRLYTIGASVSRVETLTARLGSPLRLMARSVWPGSVLNLTARGLQVVDNGLVYMTPEERTAQTFWCNLGTMIASRRLTLMTPYLLVDANISKPGCAPASAFPLHYENALIVYDVEPVYYIYEDKDVTLYIDTGPAALGFTPSKTLLVCQDGHCAKVAELNATAGILVFNETGAMLATVANDTVYIPGFTISSKISYGVGRIATLPLPPIEIHVYKCRDPASCTMVGNYTILFDREKYVVSVGGAETIVSLREVEASTPSDIPVILERHGLAVYNLPKPGDAAALTLTFKGKRYTITLPYVGKALQDILVFWDYQHDGMPEIVFRATYLNETAARVAVIRLANPSLTDHYVYEVYLGDELAFTKDYYVYEVTAGGDQSHWTELKLTLTPVHIGDLADNGLVPDYMLIVPNNRTIYAFPAHGYVSPDGRIVCGVSNWRAPYIYIFNVTGDSVELAQRLTAGGQLCYYRLDNGTYIQFRAKYTGVLKLVKTVKEGASTCRYYVVYSDVHHHHGMYVALVKICEGLEGVKIEWLGSVDVTDPSCPRDYYFGYKLYGYSVSIDGRVYVAGSSDMSDRWCYARFVCDPSDPMNWVNRACWVTGVAKADGVRCLYGRRIQTNYDGSIVLVFGGCCSSMDVWMWDGDEYVLSTRLPIENPGDYGPGGALMMSDYRNVGLVVVASAEAGREVVIANCTGGVSCTPVFKYFFPVTLNGYNPYYGYYVINKLRALAVMGRNGWGLVYDVGGRTAYVMFDLGPGWGVGIASDASWVAVGSRVFKLVDYNMPRVMRVKFPHSEIKSRILFAVFKNPYLTINGLAPGDVVIVSAGSRSYTVVARGDKVVINLLDVFTARDIVEAVESGGFRVAVRLTQQHMMQLLPNRLYVHYESGSQAGIAAIDAVIETTCAGTVSIRNETVVAIDILENGINVSISTAPFGYWGSASIVCTGDCDVLAGSLWYWYENGSACAGERYCVPTAGLKVDVAPGAVYVYIGERVDRIETDYVLVEMERGYIVLRSST